MADVTGGDLLTEVERAWPKLGVLLRTRVFPAINTVARNAAVAADGELSAPAAPVSVNVKVAGELAHITVNDPQPLQRGGRYMVELGTNEQISSPHVIDLGASRGAFVSLPTFDDDGNQHTYFPRAFVQYPGSQPGPPTRGSSFQMAGTTKLTPLPSTGSGTASTNGQQGGAGLGRVVFRSAPGPKRAVGV